MKEVKAKILSSKGALAAAMHFPEQTTGRLAVLCPGYLDSKDYKHLVGLAEALCGRGYAVVRFDPTGTWGSEGAIADYTTTQYLKDVESVIEHMLRRENYQHVLLGGHSRGGAVSILYAARDPRISLVVGIMPSGRAIAGERRKQWKATGIRISLRDWPDGRNGKKEFCVPYSYVEDADRYDVVQDVKKIDVPIILAAGELDELVLPEDVKEIFDHANEPKKFILLPSIGHDYRHRDQEVEMVNDSLSGDVGVYSA